MGAWAYDEAVPRGSMQREQAETPVSQSFPGKGLTARFTSSCLRAQLWISTHLGADFNTLVDPSQSLKKPVGTAPIFLQLPTIKLNCQYLSERILLKNSAPIFTTKP